MLSQRKHRSACAASATSAVLVGALVIGAMAGAARGEETPQTGSEVLFDFEAVGRVAELRAGEYAKVEWTSEGLDGTGAARITFAVPEGVRAFAAVVAEKKALRVRDFRPFEAMSLWIMNPGPHEAELSLCVWDENANRGFPVPSTIRVQPGKWQQVVVRLALHGLDAERIGSLHFYQKLGRAPCTLLVDDVRLLSPYDGRIAAKIQSSREFLNQARNGSAALGAKKQIEEKIAPLEKRLLAIEQPSKPGQGAAQRTRRLLELAQIMTSAQELAGSIRIRNEGASVTLAGPHVEASWLGDADRVGRITDLRLLDTLLGDQDFGRLEPAQNLERLVVRGQWFTGAGLARLPARRLARLSLGSSGAHDEALAKIGKFQQLEELELDETNVTSSVLAHLEPLEQLKSLNMSGTGVSDAGFSAIGKLSRLESLDLGRTRVTGQSLRHLANLQQLRSLNLAHTGVDDEGLSHLGELPRLESLALENTAITGAGFGRLEGLDALVSLNLNGTRVGDSALRQLGELPNLKRLEMSSTPITDASLAHVASSARLEYLDLYGTNVSDAGIAHLAEQEDLADLYLAGTRVSDAGIGYLVKLSKLERLDLEGTRITDAGLVHLKQLSNLASLRLANTRITGQGLAHLAELSQLSELDLSGTRVTDEALGALSRLENLRRLQLSGTRVTSAGMRDLAAAAQLVQLDLEATDVVDEGLDALAALANLERLNLSETAVTDEGLKHVARMKKLTSLSLDHTRITDEGLSELPDGYAQLALAHTRITDQGLGHLARNDQLAVLRLASTGITSKGLELLHALPNLRQLDLAETDIDDGGLAHLAVLPGLEELNLDGTPVTDIAIDTLLGMPGLRRLSLENSRVTAQGASYIKRRAPKLELGLVFPWVWDRRWSFYTLPDEEHSGSRSNPRTVLDQVKALGSLGYLRVHDGMLSREVLRSLKDLPALEHVSFEGTAISDAMLSELLGLSQVTRMDLSKTAITDAGLIHLKEMQGLRELDLRGTRVSGDGLAHLGGLNRLAALNLSQTALDDGGLENVARFEQLRKLELGNTRVTDRGIEHLAPLGKLQYLDLYGTGLTDAGAASLGRMKSLRYCYLSHTKITDSAIDQLAKLTELEELGLDGTSLSDRGLAALRPLLNLRRLKIGRSRVTSAGLVHLAAVGAISRLEANDLALTDEAIAALVPLSGLRRLDVSGARITDGALAMLDRFPLLEELNVQDTAVTPRGVARFEQEHPAATVLSGTTRAGYPAGAIAITALYGIAALAICFYGVHRYWLAWLLVADKNRATGPEPAGRFIDLPAVTVQLPMFNERQVAQRIIAAACALDYPRDRLQIQVLDDSTDETRQIAKRASERMAAAGHDIQYIHRPRREGFKGGALAAGLQTARGEFVAVFDADFLPPADILQRTIHYFTDPKVGMVQAAWSHLNRGQSLLTECQAMFLDGHFVVEQTVRSRNNRWFNFNGTAGLWRRKCIEEAGGWQHDTLTEDTDLSYRAQLEGWKFVYLPSVRCGAELPATMTAFLGQQHRWTKGLIQTGKKLLPRILVSSAPRTVKIEAWFHLTSPLMYLVMFLVTAVALPALFVATPLTDQDALALALGVATLGMGTCGAATFYIVSQREQGYGLARTIFKLPLLMALGIGMCAVNARAVLEALLGLKSPFVRTPKFGGRADCDPDPAVSRRPWRIAGGLVELALAGVLLACLVLSFLRPYTLIGAPFLLLFALGYLGVGWLSLTDHFGLRAGRPSQAAAGWLWPPVARYAAGALAVLLLVSISGAALLVTSHSQAWTDHGARPAMSLGLDLTTAGWAISGNRSPGQATSAVREVHVERGSLVLNVQLDETTDQGEIALELQGALEPLGDSIGPEKQLAFDVEYPSRFTGEFQAFVKDRQGRSEYGSMEFVEGRDPRGAVTVALVPSRRVPPMGYQDQGFDASGGMQQIGLKISAQSDRVRGAGYRPFRGTIRIAKARVVDVDRDLHPEPEIRAPAEEQLRALPAVSANQFLANSGLDRPWPLGYAFSGPVADRHVEELERTYAAIARSGYGFSRVYIGDYRTGLVLDGQGKIVGADEAFLEYVDRLAAIANRHGITVMFSLTDNTMADGRGVERVEFIREGDDCERFIKHALAQLVKKLAQRQVIWDIFNEPENVTALPLLEVQRYVDRVLAVLRQADRDARFTVVSRGRAEIAFWQGRGLDLYSHNIFTARSLDEALAAPRLLDAPVLVAEMAPELATTDNLEALRHAGYSGVGIWGWGTEDKYEQSFQSLFSLTSDH
ncbi:MAG: glycosyltransferase [Pirellulales bacterium]